MKGLKQFVVACVCVFVFSPILGHAASVILYGLDEGPGSQLITINPLSGAGTAVGPLGVQFSQGLAYLNGNFYGVKDFPYPQNDQLISINPTTGASTIVGTVNGYSSLSQFLGFVYVQ